MGNRKGRGLFVWLALFCSLLLPLTALGEMRVDQQQTISCGMPDCHCNCCPKAPAHFSGCRGCYSSLPYLSSCGTIIYHRQASPHRLEETTPVLQAFTADIFHPPELRLS